MRTQRTASTLPTDLADPHAPRPAGGNVSRSRAKSRFSGSASAILSQLRSIGGGSRSATRSLRATSAANRAPAAVTVTAKGDPLGDTVQWINHQRRQVDAPRAGANGGVTKLTREQAAALNKVVPKRVAPAPPTGASGETAKAQTSKTGPSPTNPVIESDDDLFELPLPAAGRAPHKTLQQLFDEERTFRNDPELPAQTQPQSTAAAPADDDDLIEVDLHSGRVNAGADASGPAGAAAPTGLKSALRKPDPARREAKPRVSWHPDVRDTKLASAEEKGGPRQRTTDPELLEIQANTRKNEVLQEFGRLPVDEECDEGNQGVSAAPTLDRSPARREQPDESAPSASPVATAVTATAPAGRARRGGITGMLGRMVQLPRKLWR